MATSVPFLRDRQYCLPAGSGGSTGTGGGAWTYGTSVELTPSLDAASILMGLTAYNIASPGVTSGVQIGIFTGALGSETLIAAYRTRRAVQVNTPGPSGNLFIPAIIGIDNLAAGSRVSFAVGYSSPIAYGWYVRLGILHKPLLGQMATTTAVAKCLPNLGDDYSLTTGTVADTFTGWSTIRAASGPTMYITSIVANQPIADQLTEIELGTGTAGAETVLHRIVDCGGRKTDLIGGHQAKYNPIYVPANTRLAWRCRTHAAAARTVYLALNYVESFDDV